MKYKSQAYLLKFRVLMKNKTGLNYLIIDGNDHFL